jgi:predicted PurR-regulated permease PerM
MLVEGPMWMQTLWNLYSDEKKRDAHRTTVEKMYRVVTGFVNGQLAVAAIGAMASFITLFIMSLIPSLVVPSNLAMPLAVIIFLTALIPMVGTTIGGILVALILMLNSPFAALVFVIFFIIYQQIENNVISPPIQSKTVDLSVLWILMAILIGANLFGLIGGLVSIPIAGSIRILLVDYFDRAKERRKIKAEKPMAKFLAKVKKDSKTS